MNRGANARPFAARRRFRCEPSNRSSRNPRTAPKCETGSTPLCAAGRAPPHAVGPHFSPHLLQFSRRNSFWASHWPRKPPLPRLRHPRSRPRIPTRGPQLKSLQSNQFPSPRPSRNRLRPLVPTVHRPQSFRQQRLAFPIGPPTRNLPRRLSSGTATACLSKPPTPAWTRF